MVIFALHRPPPRMLLRGFPSPGWLCPALFPERTGSTPTLKACPRWSMTYDVVTPKGEWWFATVLVLDGIVALPLA